MRPPMTLAGLLTAAACTSPLPGAPDERLPQSCRDLVDDEPKAPDGDYLLYVDGHPDQPWEAYCHDMAGQPREYLSLRAEGPDRNLSRLVTYRDGDFAGVVTRYQRVRIDPRRFDIDIGDQTFAKSEGGAEAGDADVASMPFGVAAACSSHRQVALTAQSSVDLAGTPFVLDSGFCLRDASPGVSNVWSTDQSRVELLVAPGDAGVCASASVAPCPGGLYNDAGGFLLRVAYEP